MTDNVVELTADVRSPACGKIVEALIRHLDGESQHGCIVLLTKLIEGPGQNHFTVKFCAANCNAGMLISGIGLLVDAIIKDTPADERAGVFAATIHQLESSLQQAMTSRAHLASFAALSEPSS